MPENPRGYIFLTHHVHVTIKPLISVVTLIPCGQNGKVVATVVANEFVFGQHHKTQSQRSCNNYGVVFTARSVAVA